MTADPTILALTTVEVTRNPFPVARGRGEVNVPMIVQGDPSTARTIDPTVSEMGLTTAVAVDLTTVKMTGQT